MEKNLLIFGADGELGRGVTDILLKKNYDKIFLYDRKFLSEETEKNVKKIGIKDLSDEENVKEVFSRLIPGKEKLLFLFSSVGGFFGGKKLWEINNEEWESVINMNLKTGFLLAKYFSQLVKNSAGGSVCFTAAYTGINAEINKSVYGISKSALIHLVKTLALEGKEINLSANAIAPYIIDTKENRKWMKGADHEEWIKPVEIGEIVADMFDNYRYFSGNILTTLQRIQ